MKNSHAQHEQHADDVREIRMIFTARECVMIGRALTMFLNVTSQIDGYGWLSEEETALVEDLRTGIGMVVRLPEQSDGTQRG